MAFVNLWAKLHLSGVNTSAETLMFCRTHRAALATLSLVDSEVTVGTICGLKQVSHQLQ